MGVADSIKISKTLVGHAWNELTNIIKAELNMEVRIYEKSMGSKPNGELRGHMHAWYAAAEKYVLSFLREWKAVRLQTWKEEGMDEALEAAQAMGWERQKSMTVMRGFVENAKATMGKMRRMELSWKKETKAEERKMRKMSEKEKGKQAEESDWTTDDQSRGVDGDDGMESLESEEKDFEIQLQLFPLCFLARPLSFCFFAFFIPMVLLA